VSSSEDKDKDDVYELLDDIDHDGGKISLSFGDNLIYIDEPEGGLDEDIISEIAKYEDVILEYFGVEGGQIVTSISGAVNPVVLAPVSVSIRCSGSDQGCAVSASAVSPDVVVVTTTDTVTVSESLDFVNQENLINDDGQVWEFESGGFNPLMVIHGKTVIPPDQYIVSDDSKTITLPDYIVPDDKVYAMGLAV